jgi:hypothetical protein
VDESETGSANFFGPARGAGLRFGPLFKLHESLVRCWKKKSAQFAHSTLFGPLTRSPYALVCCLRRARSASRTKPVPKAVPGRGRSAELVDGSETGSANFFGPARSARPRSGPVEGVWGNREVPPKNYDHAMHLRPPSIDPGITSFIWALVLGLFIWGGLLAIGVSQATALVLALLSFGAIFLFVRLRGGDDPVR